MLSPLWIAAVASSGGGGPSIPLVVSPNSILTVRADLGVAKSNPDVTAWVDQSGEAHDYGNAGSGTYVQYDDTTWGLPVLTAPDTSRRLVGHADVATSLLGDDNAYTIYGLVYLPTAVLTQIWGLGVAGGKYIQMFTPGTGDTRLRVYAYDGTTLAIATSVGAAFAAGAWHAFCFRCHGTTADIFIDSVTANVSGAAFNTGDKSGDTPGHTLFAIPPATGGASSIHEWEVCTGAAHIDDITAKMASMLASKAALEA